MDKTNKIYKLQILGKKYIKSIQILGKIKKNIKWIEIEENQRGAIK